MTVSKTSLRERLENVALRLVARAVGVLPRSQARAVGAGRGAVAWSLLGRLRQVGMQNLALAFPEKTVAERNAILRGVFRSLGWQIGEFCKMGGYTAEQASKFIRYDGLENYLGAREKGKGVLVLTGHLGAWELSSFYHSLMGYPMSLVIRRLDNPLVDEMVEERRTMSGNHLILKKDAARSVLKALKLNQPVGILIDQNTAPSEGVFINFFGKAACAGVAFVKLAYHSQAPVIPGFALWDEATERYVLHFLPEVRLSGDAAADTQKIHSILEEVIRQYPDQWMWIHRRWKTQPPGEGSIY